MPINAPDSATLRDIAINAISTETGEEPQVVQTGVLDLSDSIDHLPIASRIINALQQGGMPRIDAKVLSPQIATATTVEQVVERLQALLSRP